MIPVTQTEIGVDNVKANCLMACVASVLEVPLESLPLVHDYEATGSHWWTALTDALRPHGFVPLPWQMSGPEYPPIAPPGYHIATGKSPRSGHQHAVVAHDGKIVHDPHPSRAGLDGEIASWILFMPLAKDPLVVFDEELDR